MGSSSSIRLSQSSVKAAQPQERRYELWDSELSGFGVRIEPTGIKTFFVRYRAGGGRRGLKRFVKIGRYGSITVDEARKEAKRVLGAAATGNDPAAERKSARNELTIRELVELYEREGIGHLKPLTAKYTMGRIRNHIVPLLGSLKVSDLRIADIKRFIAQVTQGASARDTKAKPRSRVIVRGGPGAAAKAARDLSALMSFAVEREMIPYNPCFKVEKPAFRERQRFLEPDEIARLIAAADRLQAEGGNPKVTQIVKLWLYTGCRHREISGLRWSEVDFARDQLVLAETKTGRSVRPLIPQAKDLLASIERDPSSPFVFPAERGDGHYDGIKRHWKTLLTYARLNEGDAEPVVPHTLRHTMGSVSASSGESALMVGALLGHANLRSTQRYIHLQRDAIAQSAKRVGAVFASTETAAARKEE